MNFRSFFALIILIVFGFLLYKGFRAKEEERIKEKQPTEKRQTREEETTQQRFLTVTCPGCHGKKRIYDPVSEKTRTCYICKGVGTKNLPSLPPGKKLCPNCNGWGKVMYYHMGAKQAQGCADCDFCNGRGIVEDRM